MARRGIEMSRVRDITKFLDNTLRTNEDKKGLRPSTTSTLDSAAVLSMKSSSGMSVFSSLDSLPVAGLTAGQQAYITGNSKLYISNGSGWYNTAIVNATPALTLSQSGTIALASDGSTTVIRLTATDSDNDPDNLTYSIESGGDFFKMGTIVQDSAKQFTITPRSSDSATTLGNDGSATITFKASDGVNVASVQNTFTLSFVTNWATATLTETKRRDSVTDLADGDALGYMNSDFNLDGTYLAVGAPKDTGPGNEDDAGGCHVFHYNGTAWDQGTKISVLGMDASAYGAFGSTVSLNDDGDVLALGHGLYNTQQGGFHIYTRGKDSLGAGWTRRGVFTVTGTGNYYNAGGGSYEGFLGGPKISGNGLYVIISRRVESTSYGESYIFVKGAEWYTWTQQAVLRRTGRAAGDYFGQSADINKTGEYSIVGADQAGAPSNAGVAIIHLRTGTSWAQQAELTPSDGAGGDRFGADVAISGDGLYAAVTAYEDDESYNGSGSVYIFVRSGTSWSQQAKLHLGAAGAAGAHFGQSIDMNDDGDLLTVTDGGNNTNTVGTLYIYKRDGTSWSKVKELQASDAGDGDTPAGASAQYYGFGSHCSISADGNVVCGTAYPADHTDYRGAVYIWNPS